MTTDGGHRIVFKQIAGIIARRIVCKVREGDAVAAGAKFGMIRFGSRVELFVPAGSQIQVKVGDHVKAGETVIGSLPRTFSQVTVEETAQEKNAEL